jgi:Xaa-Pro aminopeptidase
MRMIKSQEEIDWARIAARLSDLSIEALIRDIRPASTSANSAASSRAPMCRGADRT